MSDGIYQYPQWDEQAALGMIPSMVHIRRFGYNPDVDAGTEDVWAYGGVRTLPTTNTALTVVSTSINDVDVTGTGIRTVRVIGLDTNYNYKEVDIALQGTTPVVTTNTDWLRVNRMFGTLAGTGGTAAGNITAVIDGKVQAAVVAGNGQTLQALHTVQAGCTLNIDRIFVSSGRMGAQDISVRLQVKNNGFNVWRELLVGDIYESNWVVSELALAAPAKTEIRVQAVTAGNNIAMSAQFVGHIYNDSYLNSISPSRKQTLNLEHP